MLLGIIKDLYDLVYAIVIPLPLDGGLNALYIVVNFVLQIVAAISSGGSTGGGGINFPGF